jgi:hypothetical protein
LNPALSLAVRIIPLVNSALVIPSPLSPIIRRSVDHSSR